MAPTEEQILGRLEARSPSPGSAQQPAPVVPLRPRMDATGVPARSPLPELIDDTDADTIGSAAPPAASAPRLETAIATESGPALRAAPRRLDLDASLASSSAPVTKPPRKRFGRGLATALLLFLLGLFVYDARDEIGTAVPAAAPGIEAYGSVIDGARSEAEALLSPLRATFAGRTP